MIHNALAYSRKKQWPNRRDRVMFSAWEKRANGGPAGEKDQRQLGLVRRGTSVSTTVLKERHVGANMWLRG
jgi:hypothetical protein